MKIIFLTSAIERKAGYWRAFFLARYLSEFGHETMVICHNRTPSIKMVKKRADNVNILLLPSLVTSRKNLFYNVLSQAITLLLHIGLNLFYILNSDIDVLHTFDALFPQNAVPTFFFKLTGKKVFVDWDDWWGKGGSLDLFFSGAYKIAIPMLTFLEEKVPLCADACTITNNTIGQRALMTGICDKKIHIIPNGANTEDIHNFDMNKAREDLNLPKDAFIYTSNIKKTSFGTKTFNEINPILLAHKHVLESKPEAKLMLMGEGGRERWIAEARLLKINKNIIYVGYQPSRLFGKYLSSSNFFLLPLGDTIFNRARSLQRLMDYMAAGRPIITTSLPENLKIGADCCFFINPSFEPRELSEKIVYAINNPELCETMGENALKKAQRHSWKNCASHLEKIYTQHL